MDESKSIDLKAKLTMGEVETSDFGILIDIFANYSGGPERIATVYRENEQEARTIAKHITFIPEFISLLEVVNNYINRDHIDMHSCARVEIELNKKAIELNNKLNDEH